MAYASGDTITADQYNIFVNNSSSPFGYNHFAGTGSANYGLGQTHIATVTGGATTITATQFNTLLTGIDNIANHTNDTMTARTAVTAGDTIAIKSNLETDLATLAASVNGGSTSATALTTNQLRQTTNSGTFNNTSTIEISVTFASADAMRHFFNAGGKIRCVMATSGSTDGDKDTVGTDLGTGLGNLDIAAEATTRSGSSETLTTNGLANGFRDLGTSYTTIIKLTSDNSGYTSNTLEIQAKLDAAVGSSTVMTIKQIVVDGDGDDTFHPSNLSGVPANPNEHPACRLTVSELHPNDTQGLAAAIQASSNAEVSNTISS